MSKIEINTSISENIDSKILKLLPGYHCGACGFKKCYEFAEALSVNKAEVESCRFIHQEKFRSNLNDIKQLLKSDYLHRKDEKIFGVLDGYIADFLLKPLAGEHSCREILYPFYQKKYEIGNLVKYRPLGCPIPHFAKIIEADKGLITVHLIGPCHRFNSNTDTNINEFEDIGVCMVGGFIGIVEGRMPKIGQTVRFLPKSCMMQKVHSGIIVQTEGDKAIIEGIDLKVWALPEIYAESNDDTI